MWNKIKQFLGRVIVQLKKYNKAPYCHQVERLLLSFPTLSTLALTLITGLWNAMLEWPQGSSTDLLILGEETKFWDFTGPKSHSQQMTEWSLEAGHLTLRLLHYCYYCHHSLLLFIEVAVICYLWCGKELSWTYTHLIMAMVLWAMGFCLHFWRWGGLNGLCNRTKTAYLLSLLQKTLWLQSHAHNPTGQ